MTRIVALSGSLRRDSYNTWLARAASQLVPDGVVVEVVTPHGIPLYDGDLEAEHGIPESVLSLKQRIVAADGLILFTPEYNNGVPGVLKNTLDWLSRADRVAVFGNRPVAIAGATPGGWGTVLAQTAWLPTLKVLGTVTYTGKGMMLSKANTAFDATGQLIDSSASALLGEFMRGFVGFIETLNNGAEKQ
ncbi:MAG TPA: NADPH-dependent FMN reductase [Pseudomonadales bacterium]|nr:NADPH-dependent FMN reductase [Pseudomonadales bacterium]